MATRLAAPTDEELAEAERKIQERRDIEEFERNRAALQARRPKGAAKLSSARTFRIAEPPLTRGPERAIAEDEGPGEETPAEVLRQANRGRVAETATPAKPKKKGKWDVPDVKNANTILDKLGIVYVEERKSLGPAKAFENLRDTIMLNWPLLLPVMAQIKQTFELLEIGLPEREKNGDRNGKSDDIGKSMKKLQHFLRGEDEDE